MMKKIVIFCSIIVIFLVIFNNNETSKIPDQAIRLRVLANSNSAYDQNVKMQVKDGIQSYLYSILNDTNDINIARAKIISNLDNIDSYVDNLLKNNNYDMDYKINYGMNYFPEKNYKGITYSEGEYESLLITLGQGVGDNWWCVLFPPLCVLEAEENNTNQVEYKIFLREIIDKIF